MITVGMNYHVIAGKQHDFEEKFSNVIAALRLPTGIPARHYGKMLPTTPRI